MSLSLQDIQALFRQHGATQYTGEPVTQLEHALQTAALAEQEEAPPSLITASLLHDLFDADVLEPIRLHVDAKRYLCARESAYFSSLSEDSVRSLKLQGGIFDAGRAAAFIALPYADDAVRLRRWDDLAKRADYQTPDYDHFARYIGRCVRA